jgi:hypothetical protein
VKLSRGPAATLAAPKAFAHLLRRIHRQDSWIWSSRPRSGSVAGNLKTTTLGREPGPEKSDAVEPGARRTAPRFSVLVATDISFVRRLLAENRSPLGPERI